MPAPAIDSTAALAVIDLQKGISELPTLVPVPEIVERTARLAAGFRGAGMPVVLITANGNAPGRTVDGVPDNDYPPDFADIPAELAGHDEDHHVVKQRWGAFHDTGLAEHLNRLGVTQLVIAGVATGVGVESTARAAYDHGLHVTIAADAVTDVDPDRHHNSLQRVFPRMAEIATTQQILDALQHL